MDQEIHDFVLQLNREAMNYLKDGDFQLSIKTLKDAEKVLSRLPPPKSSKLFGITFNNFGCFYKRMNKPNVALKYLFKACKKESVEPVDKVNLAGTLLNICAIYSQLGKHLKALEQSNKALELLEDGNQDSKHYMSTLIIAYHNTGVEHEYLNNLRQATECYKTGWTLASAYFGESHSLARSVNQNYLEALEKLEKAEIKSIVRDQQRTLTKFNHTDRPLPVISQKRSPSKGRAVNVGRTRNRSPFQDESLALDPDLNKIRFLTGERLQPMHKTKDVRVHCRIPIKDSGHYQEGRINKEDSKVAQGRTSSAPLNLKAKKYEKLEIDTGIPIMKVKNAQKQLGVKFESVLKELKQNDFDLVKGDNREKFEELINVENQQKPGIKFGGVLNDLKQDSFDWMKEENIEKFEALDEFIRGEEFIPPEESPIIEPIEKDDQKFNPKDSENLELEKREKKTEEIQETLNNSEKDLKNSSLITKQVFQGYLKRKEMLNLITSIVLIQKHVRKFQCRSIFLDIRNAVIFIQRAYRDHLKHKPIKPVA